VHRRGRTGSHLTGQVHSCRRTWACQEKRTQLGVGIGKEKTKAEGGQRKESGGNFGKMGVEVCRTHTHAVSNEKEV